MGKIRRVNLTDSIISEEEIPEKMAILAEGQTPDHYLITGHDRPLIRSSLPQNLPLFLVDGNF